MYSWAFFFVPRAAKAIAVCLVVSKLDYTSLPAGLPQTQIKRLHTVYNADARVAVTREHDSTAPTLTEALAAYA